MALPLGHPMQMKCSVTGRGKPPAVRDAFPWPGSAVESESARMGRTSSVVSAAHDGVTGASVSPVLLCTWPTLSVLVVFTLLGSVQKYWVSRVVSGFE